MQNSNSDTIKWISLSIVAAAVIISSSIIYSGSRAPSGGIVNNGNTNQPGGQQQPTGPVKVAMDDDPILGSANAPVTLIEFSDYECPFCKRHFEQVYPDIKKDYIDTGKVKLVFRDYIAVQAHNPLATTEAEAAQCVKDQGGDVAYYKFHDAVYSKTTSNGSGLLLSDLPVLAGQAGVNVATFNSCLSSRKFKAEVEKDEADAVKAGVSGTPSFFVGKSTANNVIDGTIIVGAQPYAAFQSAIDAALNQ